MTRSLGRYSLFCFRLPFTLIPGYKRSKIGRCLFLCLFCPGLCSAMQLRCEEHEAAGCWWWYPFQKVVFAHSKAPCN